MRPTSLFKLVMMMMMMTMMMMMMMMMMTMMMMMMMIMMMMIMMMILTSNTHVSNLAVVVRIAVRFVILTEPRWVMAGLISRTVTVLHTFSFLTDAILTHVSSATMALTVTPSHALSTTLSVSVTVLVFRAVCVMCTWSFRLAFVIIGAVEPITTISVAALKLKGRQS